MRIHKAGVLLPGVILLALALAACVSQPSAPPHEHEADVLAGLEAVPLAAGERLRIVATTSIVGDVVQQVGGEKIDLTVLLPLGSDPHSFEPTPRDIAAVSDAHLVLANGAGLELFLEDLLESAAAEGKMVPLSAGLPLLQSQAGHEHEHDAYDPHVWFDVSNVIHWTHNVEQALGALDPAHAAVYEANAAAYVHELQSLDAWIEEQVAQVPPANRKLVTDHTAFTYFAHRYGFEQVGAIFPGYSTLSEPSAQELAALERAIQQYEVKAVFVGRTVNPSTAQQVAEDTGVRLVLLYIGSLSEAGGPADSYEAMMRYDVSAIVEALR
ncbi:MAG: zinc ABC transporter substrate-binding protein [Chloroflexia bacterium]|nr:zinc ABC transporter substrate-binding protein [Chloroflexia bacterium]